MTSLLDETKAQAMLLTAPAGYGKTTLAQEWLQGREHVAWYRATSASADLAAFSAGLADVIAPIVPGTGDRLKQRLRVGDAPEKAVRPLAELLAEDLAAWPEDGIIVVDDYHLVMESAPVEDFVDWVLTLVPVRVLITTRRRPAWASARRVLYGEITEIGPEQLAMNNEEASRVLEGRPGDSVRMLVRQAEGWPAVIGLAALSTSLELPEERVSDALFRYFAEEVLHRETPEVQRFMMLASVPASIDPRSSSDALGVAGAESIIDRLRTEDILLESERDRLTFHPLVRDFLRRRLEVAEPDLFDSMTTAALSDAASDERWEEVLDLVSSLRSKQVAADLAGYACSELLAAGRIETLEKWLAACGEATLNSPGAVLANAELLTRKGRLFEAALHAQELAQELSTDAEQLSKAWYVAGRALHLLSDDEGSLRCHKSAHASARTAEDRANALWGSFIAAAELELDEASSFLDELERVIPPSVDARLRLANGRILVAERRTSYAGLPRIIDPLTPLAAQASDPMIATSFLGRAADLNIARGRYEIARDLAQRAIDLSEELHLAFARGLCLLSRIQAEIGLRQRRSIRRSLAEIRTFASRNEDPFIDLAIHIIGLKLALMDGRPSEGALTRPPSRDLQRSGQGSVWSLLAISNALSRRFNEAARCIDRTFEITRAVEPIFYARFAAVINGLVQRNSRLHDRGMLGDLVRDADTHEVLDAFVIAYRAFPPLLRLVANEPDLFEILTRAVMLSGDYALAEQLGVKVPQASPRSAVLARLTRREREVLGLLGKGLTNATIAKTLFITESTAKVHVHRIFEKLQVSTRVEAVLRAQELLDDSD